MTSSISHHHINVEHGMITRSRKRTFSEVSQNNDSLHKVGYKVYRSAISIPKPILDEVIKKSAKAPAIFNHNESMKNDRKRRQMTLSANKTSKAMKAFLQSLNQFIKENISENLKPNAWVTIHSRPGCQDQAAHSDYVPDCSLTAASDEQMPLAVLVAMMPGTKLNAWPGSTNLVTMSESELKRIKPIQCKEETLNPGDILVFRGDFVHAGSGYDEDNYRLHAFLDSEFVPREPNRTWLIHSHGGQEIRRIIRPKIN